jgi:hypothetical protein
MNITQGKGARISGRRPIACRLGRNRPIRIVRATAAGCFLDLSH